jgi:hypothetical protein
MKPDARHAGKLTTGDARSMIMSGQGSVYKRCGCIDTETGRQLGGRCLRLAGGRHGSWYVRLELPGGLDGGRRRIRRGGYPSRKAAAAVLARLRAPRPGDAGGRVLTLGDWLAHWLVSRTSPAASTIRGYTAHVRLPRSLPRAGAAGRAVRRARAGDVHRDHPPASGTRVPSLGRHAEPDPGYAAGRAEHRDPARATWTARRR